MELGAKRLRLRWQRGRVFTGDVDELQVVQVKTADREGYYSLQLGMGAKREKQLHVRWGKAHQQGRPSTSSFSSPIKNYCPIHLTRVLLL